jgi:hypothetical protein
VRRLPLLTALALSMVLVLPMPALGLGSVDQEQAVGSDFSASSGLCLAQTFTAGRSGKLDGASLLLAKTWFDVADLTVEVRGAAGGGPGTGVLASGTVAHDTVADFDLVWVDVQFTTPAEIEAGAVYAITAWDVTDEGAFEWYGGIGDRYAVGASYTGLDCSGASWNSDPGYDFAFRTYVSDADGGPDPDTDTDGDGVLDSVDLCPGTVLPDVFPKYDEDKGRYRADAAGLLTSATKSSPAYRIDQTGGCSAMQIIEEMGLGKGQLERGLTRGELESWIGSLAP